MVRYKLFYIVLYCCIDNAVLHTSIAMKR